MHDDQILVTFHAGMEAVAYEWGSLNHVSPKDNSPDNNAHNEIGARLVAFAGSATPAEGPGPHKLYPVGKMNSVVYPVDGGLEDWAYAAGWDSGPMRKCDNTVDINAKADRDNSTGTGTNAALVFLVETSDDKKPKDDALGGPCQILSDKSRCNGHVPRNVRLGLLAVDVVEPYVCIQSVTPSVILDDGTQSNAHDTGPADDVRSLHSPTGQFSVTWYVGGAVRVDATWLSWIPVPEQTVLFRDRLSRALSFNRSAIREQLEDYGRHIGGTRETIQSLVSSHSLMGGGNLHRKGMAERQAERWKLRKTMRQSRRASTWRARRRVGRGLTSKYSSTMSSGTFHGAARDVKSGSARWGWSDPMRPTSADVFSAEVQARTFNLTRTSRDGGYDAFDTGDTPRQEGMDRSSDNHHGKGEALPPGYHMLVAWAMVDQSWSDMNQGFPQGSPRSHLVKARSDPNWQVVNHVGKEVRGRLLWPSDPVLVHVGDRGHMRVLGYSPQCIFWNHSYYREEGSARQEVLQLQRGRLVPATRPLSHVALEPRTSTAPSARADPVEKSRSSIAVGIGSSTDSSRGESLDGSVEEEVDYSSDITYAHRLPAYMGVTLALLATLGLLAFAVKKCSRISIGPESYHPEWRYSPVGVVSVS
eukprot:gene199-201_t